KSNEFGYNIVVFVIPYCSELRISCFEFTVFSFRPLHSLRLDLFILLVACLVALGFIRFRRPSPGPFLPPSFPLSRSNDLELQSCPLRDSPPTTSPAHSHTRERATR